MKKILFSLAFLVFLNFAFAQDGTEKTDEGTQSSENVDEPANVSCGLKFTASVMFGKQASIWGSNAPSSLGNSGLSSIGGSISPNLGSFLSRSGGNSAVNMIGAAARMFATDEVAIKLSGSASISRQPQRDFIPGYFVGNNNAGNIPNINAVNQDRQFSADFAVGAEYHFRKKNLSPYAGISFPFYYYRHTAYNPYYNVDSNGNITITDIGVRVGEGIAFGASVVAGIDYYLRDNLYFGFDVKPFSFIYSMGAQHPAPGLPSAQSDRYIYALFSQPVFKIGFVF